MHQFLGLHGSSSRPESIQAVVKKLAPTAPSYCPAGVYPDGEGFTFFRRNQDFSIPCTELIEHAKKWILAENLTSKFQGNSIISVGFSSGAIFATALLAIAPELFAGAILLRPQVIADDFVFPVLTGKPVLIISGLNDSRRLPHHASKLAEQLSKSDANVTHHSLEAGHDLAPDGSDFAFCRSWLAVSFDSMKWQLP